MNQPAEETDRVLDRITDRFDSRYEGAVDRDVIEQEVHETYTELAAGAKVESLLPALTEHQVGERLAAEVGRPAPLTDPAAENTQDTDDTDATDFTGARTDEVRAGATGSDDPTGLGRPVL